MRTFSGLMPDDDGPPLFPIKATQWWFKVIEMCCHNWALIEPASGVGVTIYFFHDVGGTACHGLNFRHWQLKGRSAIVDSLNYESEDAAKQALLFNGFSVYRDLDGVFEIYKPSGEYFDARPTEEGIYSKSGYWLRRG
jgi:hypothetical protein